MFIRSLLVAALVTVPSFISALSIPDPITTDARQLGRELIGRAATSSNTAAAITKTTTKTVTAYSTVSVTAYSTIRVTDIVQLKVETTTITTTKVRRVTTTSVSVSTLSLTATQPVQTVTISAAPLTITATQPVQTITVPDTPLTITISGDTQTVTVSADGPLNTISITVTQPAQTVTISADPLTITAPGDTQTVTVPATAASYTNCASVNSSAVSSTTSYISSNSTGSATVITNTNNTTIGSSIPTVFTASSNTTAATISATTNANSTASDTSGSAPSSVPTGICPNNGPPTSTYTTDNGNIYGVCDSAYSYGGTPLNLAFTNSVEDCAELCDKTPGCSGAKLSAAYGGVCTAISASAYIFPIQECSVIYLIGNATGSTPTATTSALAASSTIVPPFDSDFCLGGARTNGTFDPYNGGVEYGFCPGTSFSGVALANGVFDDNDGYNCFQRCSSDLDCMGFSWNSNTGTCYLKQYIAPDQAIADSNFGSYYKAQYGQSQLLRELQNTAQQHSAGTTSS